MFPPWTSLDSEISTQYMRLNACKPRPVIEIILGRKQKSNHECHVYLKKQQIVVILSQLELPREVQPQKLSLQSVNAVKCFLRAPLFIIPICWAINITDHYIFRKVKRHASLFQLTKIFLLCLPFRYVWFTKKPAWLSGSKMSYQSGSEATSKQQKKKNNLSSEYAKWQELFCSQEETSNQSQGALLTELLTKLYLRNLQLHFLSGRPPGHPWEPKM